MSSLQTLSKWMKKTNSHSFSTFENDTASVWTVCTNAVFYTSVHINWYVGIIDVKHREALVRL